MKKYETTLEKYTLKSSCKDNYYQNYWQACRKVDPWMLQASQKELLGLKTSKQASKWTAAIGPSDADLGYT